MDEVLYLRVASSERSSDSLLVMRVRSHLLMESDPTLSCFFFSGRIDDKVQAVRVPPRREIACSSVAVGGGGLSRGIRRDSASGADRQSWPAGRGCRAVFTSGIQTLCHTNVYI